MTHISSCPDNKLPCPQLFDNLSHDTRGQHEYRDMLPHTFFLQAFAQRGRCWHPLFGGAGLVRVVYSQTSHTNIRVPAMTAGNTKAGERRSPEKAN